MKFKHPLQLVFFGILIFLLQLTSCNKDEQSPPPSIESFSPSNGVATSNGNAGTIVTITGNNFSSTANANEIKFNGTPATITSATTTQLTTTVPDGATSGKITVTTNGITTTSTGDFVVIDPPVITSFTPASGIASSDGVVGATVTITGINFIATPTANEVKFNGTVATVTSATTTQLIVTVPPGATTGKITVTANGITTTSGADFTVRLLHTINSFTPASGLVGETVIISGTNFLTNPADNQVKFNGVDAIVTNASATSLSVTIPTGASTGRIKVSIDGVEVTSSTDFVIPLPSITSFQPLYSLPGGSVTIAGSNFVNGSLTLNKVKVNGVEAMVTAASADLLTITVPNGATTGSLTVDVGGQLATSANTFEVLIDIPRDGLVAFYPFSGNANDISGNNLNGTLGNNVSAQIPVPTNDRFGKAGQAYDFDGVNDLIYMGNPPLLQIPHNITFSGWFNFRSLPVGSLMGLVSKSFHDNNNQFNGGFTIFEVPGAFFAWGHSSVYGQTGGYYLQSNTPTPLNTWIFITVVMDGTSIKFYKNGILVNQATGTSNTLDDGTKGDLFIGTYGNQSSTYFNFNGFIDDIAIYNRGLSDNEIMQLYQQTLSKY